MILEKCFLTAKDAMDTLNLKFFNSSQIYITTSIQIQELEAISIRGEFYRMA